MNENEILILGGVVTHEHNQLACNAEREDYEDKLKHECLLNDS